MKQVKTIFSGVQPSGNLTIGNYIGAISQWVEMQAYNNCIFSIVDYHAITVNYQPEELRKRILEITKIYLASGIDPKKSIIFQQSTVPEHTELAWILSCRGTYMADLRKMTQFKDKAGITDRTSLPKITKDLSGAFPKINSNDAKDKLLQAAKIVNTGIGLVDLQLDEDKFISVSSGLFTYPVLMAADILLYDTQAVPVGDDQKQHVELTRDIAKRFNNEYGSIFVIPEVVVRKEGARIMSLNDPLKKMSKSDSNPNSYISLLDDIDTAKKKIMKAVTDSGTDIDYDPVERPALANLLTIYATLGNRQIPRLVKDYAGKGYGDFKKDLAEVVAKFLGDFQDKFKQISDADAQAVLEEGREKAAEIAQAKMAKVRVALGVR